MLAVGHIQSLVYGFSASISTRLRSKVEIQINLYWPTYNLFTTNSATCFDYEDLSTEKSSQSM